ncbi:MAG: glycosyltransferase, partial [Chitinivibrionales bacterium]|nr:glycosyltransferase [Chitinivibrionales bacterium]
MAFMLIPALAVFAFLTFWYLLFIGFLLVGLLRLRGAGTPAGERYTVLIAARNEEQWIGRCLESVLKQTMAAERFDVVVVDDRSDDNTPRILAEIAEREPRVTVVTVTELPEGISPKKHALLRGLEAVRNPVVACTDADCIVPPTWLETIDKHLDRDTGLVQGVTSYRRVKGMSTALSMFESLDFLSHGIVSGASIGAGLPLNANGNNIAWRRLAFDDAGGYGESGTVLLGDDDLLMQRIHHDRRWQVRFMADSRGAVTTEPETTLGAMLRQRARWGSVSVHYGVRRVALLAGVFLFFCGIPAA